VLISSRSFEEYLAMFGLDSSDLAGRAVIDVAAGGSDFVAVAAQLGARALAIDAAYALGFNALSDQLVDSVTTGPTIVDELRRGAAKRFTHDRGECPQRYVAGALPRLPVRSAAAGLGIEQRQVPYDFQTGADQMLVVTSGASGANRAQGARP
jgi:hypothetical protein